MAYTAVLAGCGAMSGGWLEAITKSPLLTGRIELAGLIDIEQNLAQEQAKAFGLSAICSADLDSTLDTLKPDLVFDIVPPAARREVVLTSLKHGCHVLSEKPMATSLDDARQLVDAATAAQRVHAVIQNRRFIDGTRRIRAFLESGAIGHLTSLHCDFFLAPHFGGFREEMDHVLLLDMAIHAFDAARFMSDKTPTAVFAQETNPEASWYAHGANANAIFDLSDGVTFTYRGSWCAEGKGTSWEGSWRFIGTEGSLLWDGADNFQADVRAGDGQFLNETRELPVPAAPRQEDTHGHASVIASFLDALDAGQEPETVSSDNIKSLAMVLTAIESARTQSHLPIET